MAFSATVQGAMLGSLNVSYYQIGSNGHGFKTDCINISTTAQCWGVRLNLSGSTNRTDVIVEGNEILRNTKDAIGNAERNGVVGEGAIYTNLTWRYNKAITPAIPNISSGDPHAFYMAARDSLIEHNEGMPFAGIAGSLCVQVNHIATGIVVRYNYCHIQDGDSGILLADSETGLAGSNQIYGNILKATGSLPASCLTLQTTSDSSAYYNNVCDGFNTYFLNVRAGANSNTFKNNVCGGGTCSIQNLGTGTDCGGTCSTTNPTITMATHFASPSTGDYTLKAGSSQIDAGLDIGFPYNGLGRDRGAHETFVFASCEVQAGATSMVRVTFTNNAFPPLLPATGATTFTVRRNGSNNAVTGSVDRSGDGVFVIPVTNAYVGGDTVDISLSTNNITDSAMIGGDVNQPYVGTLTNQSCTNNAGGAAFTFTQSAYELHDWLSPEAFPVILPYGFASSGAAENFANYKVRKGGKIRLRFSVVCGGSNCPPTAFNLYRSTGGAYSALTDSFGVSGGFKFCGEVTGSPVNGSSTTDQLSTAGPFVAGGIMFTASAIPTVSGLNNGYKTELEYCVDVRDSASTGNVDFRVYRQDGTALNTYSVTPRIVIEDPAAGAQ
jgi:hypothetical protein